MWLFRFEWDKMMFRQRGMLILILYFVLKLTFLVVMDAPYHEERITFGGQYGKYLEQVRGKYTKEKGDFLEKEAEKIEKAAERLASIRQDYYGGKISEEEYGREKQELSEILKNKDGFEALYQQYLYVCEGKKNHYFLYDNGWSGLLSDNHPDFLLILALVLLVTPVLCREYETQMDVLMMTSRQGRESRRGKILLSLGVSLVMGFGSSIIELLFYLFKYGLPDSSFPLQSIEYFGNSTTRLSLWQAWLAGTGMRMVGCVLLAVSILFFASLMKKVALTVLALIASAVLPYLGLDSSTLIRLPLPVSYLMGADFWRGSQYQTDEVTGKDMLVYGEVTGREMMVLLIMTVVILIIFFVVVVIRNRNQYDGIGKMIFPKKAEVYLALILASSSLLLSGCSGEGYEKATGTGQGKEICYNTKTAGEYQDGSMCVSINIEDDMPVLSEMDGTEEGLVRNPLLAMGKGAAGNAEIKGIFGDSDAIYYMKEEIERSVDRVGVYNSDVDTVSVVRLDKESRQEKIIFEKDVSLGNNVLSIDYAINNKWQFLGVCSKFFLNDSFFFFLDSDNRVRQVNRKTEEITIPDIQWNDNIAFDGEKIYFQDDAGVLCSYCVSDGRVERHENVIMSSFYLQGKHIYYVNCLAQDKVYCYDLQRGEEKKVLDCSAIYVTGQRGELIYTGKRDGKEHKVK